MTTSLAPTSNLEEDLRRLKTLLLKHSVRFGTFTLASGQTSNVYVDCKLTTYRAEALPLVGRAILARIAERGWLPAAVGGLTLGADAIAHAAARESVDSGRLIDSFVVRKEPKKHGMQRFVEGLERSENLPVVIIDDVCTTGGSTEQAIRKAIDSKMNVIGAVCLVDREMGAPELLKREFGCDLASVFSLSELQAEHERSKG